MNKRLSLTAMLAIASFVTLVAQTTALVTYEGGYFIKDGRKWTEFRPADKVEPWNEYKQYKEDDKFFYIKSKRCNVAVPKIYHDKILVDRKKNGNWEVVYNTLSVHLLCPKGDALYYTYRNHRLEHGEYDGYFVRDNFTWREYRPRMKSTVWAEFRQTSEDSRYFTLESSNNIVYIPKSTNDDIVIKDKNNRNWTGGYKIQAIYDRSAAYPYSFDFQDHGVAKRGNNFKVNKKSGRISLDNKCNIQIAYDGKHYDLVYQSIELAESQSGLLSLISKKGECILITIDKDNKVMLYEGSALVDCKKLGKKVMFLGASGKDYRAISEQLRIGTFRM